MPKGRLEAFSDGVVAILITIMVLGFEAPDGVTIDALAPLTPVLLTYALTFVHLAIYWNNHHHLLQAAAVVDGRVLWANLHLLFWLSLFPFVNSWMGRNPLAPLPTAAYGTVFLLAGVAYFLLVRALIAVRGQRPALAAAIGDDRKGKLSLVAYAGAVAVAGAAPALAVTLYVVVAIAWLIPDRRIERALDSTTSERPAGPDRTADSPASRG